MGAIELVYTIAALIELIMLEILHLRAPPDPFELFPIPRGENGIEAPDSTDMSPLAGWADCGWNQFWPEYFPHMRALRSQEIGTIRKHARESSVKVRNLSHYRLQSASIYFYWLICSHALSNALSIQLFFASGRSCLSTKTGQTNQFGNSFIDST